MSINLYCVSVCKCESFTPTWTEYMQKYLSWTAEYFSTLAMCFFSLKQSLAIYVVDKESNKEREEMGHRKWFCVCLQTAVWSTNST